MATSTLLFDDARGLTAPLTDYRPSFDIRTGALTTRERLTSALGLHVIALFVPGRLEALVRSTAVGVTVNSLGAVDSDVLVLNGRCVLPIGQIRTLALGGCVLEKSSGDLIAARLSRHDALALAAGGFDPAVAARHKIELFDGHALLSRPWHVRTFRDAALDADLATIEKKIETAFCPASSIRIGNRGLDIHPSAKVYPGVVFDCEAGPIVIDEGATIRPACTIIGPVYIGRGVTILDRALIKGHTAIGPSCKIAGEVGGTIFQGFANKAHDGHLGDSYVGEWSNLGAGTTNSNLLNTYGEVTCKPVPGGSNERSGLQFLGAIIGDHVKTAISTRIMTGSIIHSGAMWAAAKAITGCVPPFAWVTDESEKRFRLDKFIDIARTVMGRRKLTMSDSYEAVARGLFESSSASSGT